MPYFFDKDHSPDLLDVALKGKYLAEVSILLREQRDILIKALAQLPKQEVVQPGGMIVILSTLADYFDNPKAQQFGISLSETEAVLDKLMANPSASMEEMREQLRSASNNDSPQEIKMQLNDSIEGGTALALRNIFSACIAIQEQREADYKKLMDGHYADAEKHLGTFLPQLQNLPEQNRLMNAVGMCITMNYLYDIAKSQKARRSPVADLTRYQTEKAEEVYKNFVANLFNIDTDTQAGKSQLQEKLQLVEKAKGEIQKSGPG